MGVAVVVSVTGLRWLRGFMGVAVVVSVTGLAVVSVSSALMGVTGLVLVAVSSLFNAMVSVLKIAIHLKKEEADAGQHQGRIRGVGEAFERGPRTPGCEAHEHHGEGCYLAKLHAQVKGEDAKNQPVLAKR